MEAFDIVHKYTLDELCLGISMLLAVSEFDINEQKACVKYLSLNRNTQKTRFCIDQLMKIL